MFIQSYGEDNFWYFLYWSIVYGVSSNSKVLNGECKNIKQWNHGYYPYVIWLAVDLWTVK